MVTFWSFTPKLFTSWVSLSRKWLPVEQELQRKQVVLFFPTNPFKGRSTVWIRTSQLHPFATASLNLTPFSPRALGITLVKTRWIWGTFSKCACSAPLFSHLEVWKKVDPDSVSTYLMSEGTASSHAFGGSIKTDHFFGDNTCWSSNSASTNVNFSYGCQRWKWVNGDKSRQWKSMKLVDLQVY